MEQDSKKLLSVATHLSQFFAFFLFPLIIFLVIEDKDVKEHAREVLNWSISSMIYIFISFVLLFIIIGIVGIVVMSILSFIFPILGAIKASDGKVFRYPLTIRLV